VIDDSFIVMSNGVTKDLEKLAKNAGNPPSNEIFLDNSVSVIMLSGEGFTMIPEQYRNGVPIYQ
jgi:hypothetical protein